MNKNELREIIKKEVEEIDESNVIQKKIRKSLYSNEISKKGLKIGDKIEVDLGGGLSFEDRIVNIIDGAIFINSMPKAIISPNQVTKLE